MDQKVDIARSPAPVPAAETVPQAVTPVLPRSVSLSTKLLLLTGLFVMLAEVLIFVQIGRAHV